MGEDALRYYILFLKTNVSCISDISPLENKLHMGDVLVSCSIPTAHNSA